MNNMQKIIRIVLPWACFVLIVWVCCFRGSDYIDWRWLVGAVGISAVCYAMLYVKRHKMLGKIEEHRNQLKQQAEEAMAPELENINGNWLKKDMLKRRMIREYLEKNTDYYADVDGNDSIRKVQDWISSLESSLFLLFLPFWGIIFWGIIFILFALLLHWSFPIQMAICGVMSVVASVILIWRRNYVLAPIAIGLAVMFLYGLFNAGIDGVEMPAYHMVVENEGNIFLAPSHVGYTMWGSIVILCVTNICLALYPFLKKKALVIYAILILVVVEAIRYGVHMDVTPAIPISYSYYLYVLLCAVNADLAVMLGISYNAAFILLFVYLVWLLPVIFALPAFVRSWKGMGELKERSPLFKKTKYRRQY